MGLQGPSASRKRAKDSFGFQQPASASCSAVNEERHPDSNGNQDAEGLSSKVAKPPAQFSTPGRPADTYMDGRRPYDWKSKYDPEARVEIAYEEKRLLSYLSMSLALAAFSLMLSGQAIRIPLPFNAVSSDGNPKQLSLTISCHILAVFLSGVSEAPLSH